MLVEDRFDRRIGEGQPATDVECDVRRTPDQVDVHPPCKPFWTRAEVKAKAPPAVQRARLPDAKWPHERRCKLPEAEPYLPGDDPPKAARRKLAGAEVRIDSVRPLLR